MPVYICLFARMYVCVCVCTCMFVVLCKDATIQVNTILRIAL